MRPWIVLITLIFDIHEKKKQKLILVHIIDVLITFWPFHSSTFRCMYLPNPSTVGGMQHKIHFYVEHNFLNAEFSFLTGCLTKAKESSLLYYLHIAGERTDRFMSFPRAWAWSETQTTLSRFSSQIADSISYSLGI